MDQDTLARLIRFLAAVPEGATVTLNVNITLPSTPTRKLEFKDGEAYAASHALPTDTEQVGHQGGGSGSSEASETAIRNARTALLYFSSQMKSYLPESDWQSFSKPYGIIIDCEKVTGHPLRYRLTVLGRLAVAILLGEVLLQDSGNPELTDRVVKALQKEKMHPNRKAVLCALLAAPDGEWLSMIALGAAVEKDGLLLKK